MRRFLRVCGLLVLCLCVLAGLVLLLNGIDQPLLPEAQTLLREPADPLPREQNALYAVIGMGLKDPDFERAGWDIAQEFAAQVKAGRDMGAPLPGSTQPRLEFVGDRNFLPPLAKLDTTDGLLAGHPAEVDHLLADNQEFLRRYSRLKQYPHFSNTLPVDTMTDFVPSWDSINLAKRLWALDLERAVAAGRIDEAISRLDEDAAFWRRLLAEPNLTLIAKSVMTAQVRADFRLASALIRNHPLEAPQLAALQPIAAPLTAAERSMEGPFQDKFRVDDGLIFGSAQLAAAGQSRHSLTERVEAWIDQRLLVPHATVNLLYRQARIDIETDRDPCTQFAANKNRQLGFPPLGWWSFWYNPNGKMLAGIASGPHHDYSGRMCDLEGFQRLLALQLLLRENQIGDDHIAAFIQQAGPDYADPYSGTPMQWQAQQHALSFAATYPMSRELLPWPI
jgi:hypothetical protein